MLDSISFLAVTATAIVLEASPFLLLGSLLAACMEVYVSADTMARFIPKRGFNQVLVGVFAGVLLPTCECGIVPVARKLIRKGVPPRAALPYMMAAPVVNPVVIASTLFAFRGDVEVVLLRCLLVLVPAISLGLVLGNAPAEVILRNGRGKDAHDHCHHHDHHHSHDHGHDHSCGHDHGHDHHHDSGHDHGDGCGCGNGVRTKSRLLAVLFHTGAEFVSMARFLILGALVAAGFKTFLPQGVMELFADNSVLAVGGLMLLAILLSVCSEADAFVAASFATFPLASKLAFMAVGPMVDLKLIPMFLNVFTRRVALALIVVPVVSIFAMAVVLALGGVI